MHATLFTNASLMAIMFWINRSGACSRRRCVNSPDSACKRSKYVQYLIFCINLRLDGDSDGSDVDDSDSDSQDEVDRARIAIEPPSGKFEVSKHTNKITSEPYVAKVKGSSCCSFQCMDHFRGETSVRALLLSWDLSAKERRQKAFHLLSDAHCTIHDKARAFCHISGAEFDVRLKSSSIVRQERTISQVCVCFKALCALSGVHKSVWRDVAEQVVSGSLRPRYGPIPHRSTVTCLLMSCPFFRERAARQPAQNKQTAKHQIKLFLDSLRTPEKHDPLGYALDQESRREVFNDYIALQEVAARENKPSYPVKPNTFKKSWIEFRESCWNATYIESS
jgi:hypothetical protein